MSRKCLFFDAVKNRQTQLFEVKCADPPPAWFMRKLERADANGRGALFAANRRDAEARAMKLNADIRRDQQEIGKQSFKTRSVYAYDDPRFEAEGMFARRLRSHEVREKNKGESSTPVRTRFKAPKGLPGGAKPEKRQAYQEPDVDLFFARSERVPREQLPARQPKTEPYTSWRGQELKAKNMVKKRPLEGIF